MSRRAPRRAVPFLTLALAGALTGCSSDPQLSAPSPAATSPQPPAPPVNDTPAQVTLTLAGGKVTGDTDVQIALNSRVSLSVTTDVAGQVLVQPNGLALPAKAGTPVTAAFIVDQPGTIRVSLDPGPVLSTITVA